MKFSKKTAHRLIVSLAMLAPVVYLFGSMFFGLAGAHGEQVFKADETPLKSYNVEFNQLVPQHTVDLGDYYDDYFYSITTDNQSNSFYSFQIYLPLEVGHKYYFRSIDNNAVNAGGYNLLSPTFVGGPTPHPLFSALFEPSVSGTYSFGRVLNNTSDSSLRVFSGHLGVIDFTKMFGAGYEPTIDYFNAHFPELYYEYTLGEVVTITEEGVGNYEQDIFNSFFPSGNFLERVGLNALNSEPIGFAPFGTFLSYLDVNVFHAANSQIALMLYGMVYWSLHVIIADLVYHVAVFIPNIIQRVFDWFGQKGLEDD